MASGRAKNGHLVFSVSSSSAQHDAIAMVSRCSRVERFGSDACCCCTSIRLYYELLIEWNELQSTDVGQ